MKNADFVRVMRVHPLNEATATREPDAPFTPGQFFREAGVIAAVCLGLGVLTRVLLG